MLGSISMYTLLGSSHSSYEKYVFCWIDSSKIMNLTGVLMTTSFSASLRRLKSFLRILCAVFALVIVFQEVFDATSLLGGIRCQPCLHFESIVLLSLPKTSSRLPLTCGLSNPLKRPSISSTRASLFSSTSSIAILLMLPPLGLPSHWAPPQVARWRPKPLLGAEEIAGSQLPAGEIPTPR